MKSKYQECVEEIERWALRMINCSHMLCSLAEGSYEEIFGKQALSIINKQIEEVKKNGSRTA